MTHIFNRLNNSYPQLLNDVYSYLLDKELAADQCISRFFKNTLAQFAELVPPNNVCLIQTRQVTAQDLSRFWEGPQSDVRTFKQCRVAILTAGGTKFEKYKGDDKCIIAAFLHYGVWAQHVVWNDPEVNWRDYNAVIVRSTWDYSNGGNFHPFTRVLTRIEKLGIPLFNSLDTILWNSNKKYLRELDEKGVSSIPTEWITFRELDNVAHLMKQKGWVEGVIKPTVSAGGANTFRFTTQARVENGVKNLSSTIRECKASGIQEWMLQPFLPEILNSGEISVLLLEGQPVKIIQKKPSKARNEFRVQDFHGGTVHRLEKYTPDLLGEVQEIFVRMKKDVLMGRIDLVRGMNRRWQVMEAELIEPFLFFDHSKRLAFAFAWATIIRLYRRQALYACNIKISDYLYVQSALGPFKNTVYALPEVFRHEPLANAVGVNNVSQNIPQIKNSSPATVYCGEVTVKLSAESEMRKAIVVTAESSSFTAINRYDLKPGQWVVFSHDREEVQKELQGPFKVINRDDDRYDMCRCFLMNVEGRLVDYCPRMCILDLKSLPWGYTVKIVVNSDIAKALGASMATLHQKSIDHLKKLSQFPYFGYGFNPEDQGTKH